ncbi:DNA mismatch repair protein MutS [Methylopila jiangsuensis]|uniref:DNA mismatch repair protein MutS n=2 Tax=Methylopila jiangsuensis TaxID=586230 RepID=A0A9W6JMJ4_9HYPH|nr:DNA mismatch repair protein MutS [Methylopila jiangsuensis]MDR6284397.1 DNA mismatch repair protein MutS [Methylopila jiangsuensis]GLK78218.1 DNA mismatch repair protein MutS [Methylopila jiangsuensis]
MTDATTASARVTPMMEQYVEIKTANPDSLLFYRMGDFYELFFEDAEIASRTLGITLTKRGKHLGEDIPMCGVPVERADDYLQRLIAAGHRVAVCEQTEDPKEAKKRGGKSVVRRDVVRLVTPGTLTEDALLEPRRANLLAAVVRVRAETRGFTLGLAHVDISTGSFSVGECEPETLSAALARLDPAEVLIPEALRDEFAPAVADTRAALTPVGRDLTDPARSEARLAGHFGVATVEAFGPLSKAEVAAAAAIVVYLERTQLASRPPLARPLREGRGAAMEIDAATRANLELTRTLSGQREGSLLSVIDLCVTSAGSRLLAQRVAGPLLDPAAIARRHDAVEALVAAPDRRRAIRAALGRTPDLARAAQRVAFGRGGPRDLAAIRDALMGAEALAAVADGLGGASAELGQIARALEAADHALAAELAATLDDELPLLKRDGGFVRAGADPRLDEARALRDESRKVIARLQASYADATDVRTLRIKHNNVLGYFIEVPQAHGERLLKSPHAESFVHRQTMAGAMRFTTTELGELERRIGEAGETALALELAIFEALAGRVSAAWETLRACADALAALDVAAALAELAVDRGHVRPHVDDSLDFHLENARHPVVERALQAAGKPFVPNDATLSEPDADAGLVQLITGPNMGGKSTYLRQAALAAVLAQAGAFVPAQAARIGVVDRLYSRVGAADDLARGRSTFMVEMVETAAILNTAGPRALVILDEIGRGTATFDGLSIAWAAIEHLHEVNRCRALFATHFHELTALARRLPRLRNATVRVKEWKGEVVFLHEVAPGVADRSYGIQVAKLAGLPPAVVKRAKAVLDELEAADRASPVERMIDDLPLFAAVRARSEPDAADPLHEALDAIEPDELTPKGALEVLYRLKALRRG